MIGLHLAQIFIPAPPALPDLYEVLWSVAGCGMFLIAWLVTVGKLYSYSASTTSNSMKNPLSPNQHVAKEKAD
jgi:hypothetical protein